MPFGALKSAEAVVRALLARDVTEERVSKVFRHLKNGEEYRAVYGLLAKEPRESFMAKAMKARELLDAMKGQKGAPYW